MDGIPGDGLLMSSKMRSISYSVALLLERVWLSGTDFETDSAFGSSSGASVLAGATTIEGASRLTGVDAATGALLGLVSLYDTGVSGCFKAVGADGSGSSCAVFMTHQTMNVQQQTQSPNSTSPVTCFFCNLSSKALRRASLCSSACALKKYRDQKLAYDTVRGT